MLGLMSTVFFLTPAHAEPTASAHASVRPVMVLVAIMWFLLRNARVVAARPESGPAAAVFARERPPGNHKNELINALVLSMRGHTKAKRAGPKADPLHFCREAFYTA